MPTPTCIESRRSRTHHAVVRFHRQHFFPERDKTRNPLRHATHLLALGAVLSGLIAPLVGQAQCDRRHFTVIDVP